MKMFFVTGAARSGTTLVDRMFHSLASTAVASQPMPGFYAEWKKEFFNREPVYREPVPHHHHFPGIPGWYDAFASFLASHAIPEENANNFLSQALESKGQDSIFLREHATQLKGGTFIDCWRDVHERLRGLTPGELATRVGSKEIYCEDFVPALLEAGIRCVLVIRDPRAVITSMNHGRYLEKTRKPYPLLLNLRNWRKSAGYWLAYASHPLALCLRYEDVTHDPSAAFARMAAFLETQPSCQSLEELHDESGAAWSGNSSFLDSPGDQPRWKTLLPEAMVQAIETLAWPELLALGYTPVHDKPDFSSLPELRERADDVRPEYLEGNELSARQLALEEARWQVVASDERATSELVMPKVRAILSAALRENATS